jgi:hypothetical protein
MNAIEILGLACVDKKFRDRLFTEQGLKEIIFANRTDLTWAEEEGLIRITAGCYPVKKGMATTSNGPMDPDSGEPPLKKELEDVGDAIARMCPEDPCPWPKFFTQQEP